MGYERGGAQDVRSTPAHSLIPRWRIYARPQDSPTPTYGPLAPAPGESSPTPCQVTFVSYEPAGLNATSGAGSATQSGATMRGAGACASGAPLSTTNVAIATETAAIESAAHRATTGPSRNLR